MPTDTVVAEKPLLFSGPMVKAILAGTKCQTRRVVRLADDDLDDVVSLIDLTDGSPFWRFSASVDGATKCDDVVCPYGQSGNRLWVKETFARRLDVDPVAEPEKARHYALYRADGTSLDEPHWHSYPDRWTPSIHCPRWASRITLELTEVRVERLQAISETDARAEGVWDMKSDDGTAGWGAGPPAPRGYTYRNGFKDLWQSINGKRADREWESNPWVWVLAFRRLTPPTEAPDHA